jgi:peptidoglycan hydrolase-like protein with peptidoglycan-binding domain
MLVANCFTVSCTCRPASAFEAIGFRDITAPVGQLGNLGPGNHKGNLPEDTKTVQELLNLVAVADGGQRGPGGAKGLKEDGIVGPLTRGAIATFQKKQFPDKTPDSVVEPHKRTIHRLNTLAFPGVDDGLREKGRAAISQAAEYIKRARHLVGVAQMQMPGGLFKNEKAERLLNYHFKIDRSTDRARDLRMIDSVLFTMYLATAHVPLGPNQKSAFGYIDTMPASYTKDPPYAFTFGGGYQYLMGKTVGDLLKFLNLKKAPGMGSDIRVDQIYLTRRVLDAAPGIITYAIIHELGHYCGGVNGDIDFIDDRAYLHRQKDRYEKLSTYESMTNADCYSQFCWENVHGSIFKP